MDQSRQVKRAKNFKRPTPEQIISDELSYKYTFGEEFTTVNGHEYIGEYHRLKDGRVFSGPIKSITGLDRSVELIEFYASKNNFAYDNLQDFKAPLKKHSDPEPYEFVVASDDGGYGEGFVMRYFVQKRGLGTYAIEIDELQKDKFASKDGIDGRIYRFVDVRWQLVGTPEIVEEQNKIRVNIASITIPDLPFLIRNYTQYARFTSQTEFDSLDALLRKRDKFIKDGGVPIQKTYDRKTGQIIPPQDP